MKKEKMIISEETLLLNYKVNADSPYNDGWTQDFYRDAYNRLLKKIRKRDKKSQTKK